MIHDPMNILRGIQKNVGFQFYASVFYLEYLMIFIHEICLITESVMFLTVFIIMILISVTDSVSNPEKTLVNKCKDVPTAETKLF